MRKKKLSRIISLYVASLVLTLSLLIFWTIYVLQSAQTINNLITRLGGTGSNYHWIILSIGCFLCIALIVGLSLFLAQTVSEYRYNRKQDEFVANITHEMKSPLAAVKLHAQTLLSQNCSTEELNSSAGHILTQIERMSTLVDNVLEISRIHSSKTQISLKPLALKNFFEEWVPEFQNRVESQGLRFQAHIDATAEILANPLSLQRVLNNLIENAIKASQPQDTIGCDVYVQQAFVFIEIWDQGLGIPPKEHKKIFERFYQIGSEIRGRRKGTGLGLAIVKGLVKEMKGSIQVKSFEDQRGSRFIVKIPKLS